MNNLTAAKAAEPKRVRLPKPNPILRFSPTAWAKLLFLRDAGTTEIGAFGIALTDDPLYIQDVVTVLQSTTAASVAFDDDSVADYFDQQVDFGRKPETFARIWLHTHPGDSPCPSGMDEDTFSRVFGHCQWAIMFILAKGGKSYARLRFNVGPRADVTLPVEVDYRRAFQETCFTAWLAEYRQNVKPELWADVLADDADDATAIERVAAAALHSGAIDVDQFDRIADAAAGITDAGYDDAARLGTDAKDDALGLLDPDELAAWQDGNFGNDWRTPW